MSQENERLVGELTEDEGHALLQSQQADGQSSSRKL